MFKVPNWHHETLTLEKYNIVACRRKTASNYVGFDRIKKWSDVTTLKKKRHKRRKCAPIKA